MAEANREAAGKLADEIVALLRPDGVLSHERQAIAESIAAFGAIAQQQGWVAACEFEGQR